MLTVVIPAHNREAMLRDTLASIAAQAYKAPVILVDNNSTDGTHEVMLRWAEAHPEFSPLVLKETTPGASSARNCGLAHVRTPWVMFFDSDDTMAPTHLQRVAQGIAANPEADIVGWDIEMRWPGGRRKIGPFDTRRPLWSALFQGSMATLRWAARTALVRQAGSWNPAVSLWDDAELGARMLALGPRMAKLPGEPTVHVAMHADTLTGERYYDAERRVERAIDALAPHVPPRYVAMLRALYAGRYAREGAVAESLRLRQQAVEGQTFWLRERLYAAYWHTRIGLPGAAKIYF